MNENFSNKDDTAIHEHNNIPKQQYNEETHNIYIIDKTNTYNIKHNRYTGGHY